MCLQSSTQLPAMASLAKTKQFCHSDVKRPMPPLSSSSHALPSLFAAVCSNSQPQHRGLFQ
jgi:hypothetical protein